ncbi:MAG TPA: prolyl oligopeptidase family serine peptidase [Vicinamibacterales bacterium]|nr:prolyl oligopeptidase family serine peptidase [Vicinamibacterales bacterium]
MILLRFAGRAAIGLIAATLITLPGSAQDGYRTPPDAITKILDSPAPPVVTVSSDRKWLLITTSDVPETTIAELAEPTMYLAGRRFYSQPQHRIDFEGVRTASLKPVDGGAEITIPVPNGARLTPPQWSRDAKRLAYFVMTPDRMTLHIFDAATGASRAVTAPGGQIPGRLEPSGGWTRDGRHFLFSATTREGEALWVADVDAGTAKRLTPPRVNYVAGGCAWTAGRAPAVCLLFPEGRGAEPKRSDAPAGPIVQESYGRAVPARTNTYLLKDRHDETLFDYYMTSQLVSIGLDGKMTPIGKPGVHALPSASPDGKYLLTRVTHRPYSYQVGQGSFPVRTEVWTTFGELMKTVYDRPLVEAQPSMRDSTTPGVRTITWRADQPATLIMVQALDDGDPRRLVAKRDRVSMLPAPFTGEPQPFLDTEMRYGGLQWLSPQVALVSDFSSQKTRARTWVIDPSLPDGGPPRPLWDYNIEDRINAPGSLMYRYDLASDRQLPITSPDGRFYYLTGPGASKEKDGDRPYLDRMEIATGRTERLWQSAPPNYEAVVALLDASAAKAIVRRESASERPDYYVVDIASKQASRLTNLPDPAPFFSTVKAELLTYTRPDGVKLSGTLYLPPGYDRARDGKLPFFLWAYPQEFMSEDAASQVAGSPYQFRRPSRADHLLLLAAGYGVLDNPTMPIVGKNGVEPNDGYVPQLVASAKAAIDKLEELGVGDRDRMGVGGHSYGAFMTGNLLAHSDLFRAGIARSGAYNRTLTPFGFQAEPRTYWQAPEVYDQMSPFHFADKIKEPILLIHGTHDNNQGTFPVQSERMFAALKGNGGNVRYVQLPLESHGYIARESRRHVIWEMVNWLDTHVKPPKKGTSQH